MTDQPLRSFPPGSGKYSPGGRILIICDFDGTACAVDMGNRVLDRFAGEGWKEIDRAYSVDEIGSRLAYTRVASLFRGTKGEMLEFVNMHALLDPYFLQFCNFCLERGFDLKIASDGLDFYIDAVLDKYGLTEIQYYSNAVTKWHREGISIEFPYQNDLCGKCGTCKTSIVKSYTSQYQRVIYIGDSYSDVCPARNADLVFAKYILYEKCRKNGTACIPYENFRDVMDYLNQHLSA